MSNSEYRPLRGGELICSSDHLAERDSHLFRIHYRGELRDAMLIRHNGAVYGYLNRCVHMPKRLDCEQSYIFDKSGKFIRCSMHGIIYDPGSGLCQSEICAGKALTALKVGEHDNSIYLLEKHASLYAL